MKRTTAAFKEAWKRNTSAHCVSSESVCGRLHLFLCEFHCCALGHLHFAVLCAQFCLRRENFLILTECTRTVGALAFSSIKDGLQQHRVVMGDMYR